MSGCTHVLKDPGTVYFAYQFIQEGLALERYKGTEHDHANNAARLSLSAELFLAQAVGGHWTWEAAVGVHKEDYFPSGVDGREEKLIANKGTVSLYRVCMWVIGIDAWQLSDDGWITRYIKEDYQFSVLDWR